MNKDSTNKAELLPFDICIKIGKNKQQLVYMDGDLKQIIDTLVRQHKEVIIKVNWFSPDVIAIVPD